MSMLIKYQMLVTINMKCAMYEAMRQESKFARHNV